MAIVNEWREGRWSDPGTLPSVDIARRLTGLEADQPASAQIVSAVNEEIIQIIAVLAADGRLRATADGSGVLA